MWEQAWKWCRRQPTAASLIAVSLAALLSFVLIVPALATFVVGLVSSGTLPLYASLVCSVVAGVALEGYVASIYRRARLLSAYQADLEDLMFHFVVPAVVYGNVFVAGMLAWSAPDTTLYMAAATMLALLIIGIHNAWDSAVWMVMRSSS